MNLDEIFILFKSLFNFYILGAVGLVFLGWMIFTILIAFKPNWWKFLEDLK